MKLTESASEQDLKAWREGEQKAQDGRMEDFQTMDYYALRMEKGMNYSPCLLDQ